MADDKITRMQQLISELNEASDAYYNGRSELMTDYEWDQRFDELKRLETETGTTLPDSPTQKVSEDTITGQKEAHEFAALSLAKTKQMDELVKWAEERPIWISWKLDGLTLVVTYDDGRLTKVVTRGNGHIGTNITHLSRSINGIPQEISAKGHTVIRGEAVISYDDFERFVMESGEDYANPRNLASGSLTLKDPDEVKARHIQWIPFTLVYTEEDIVSWGDRMAWLDRQGFTTVERQRIEQPSLPAVEACLAGFTAKVTSKQNPYPVDGLVVCYDDTAYAQTGSVTGHHATRAGLAFKWQDEAADTILKEVEWSCAASTISPVAVFQPVELEGTTVKRASLCNISECERLGIGGAGTQISVIKANKIIPKVIKVNACVGTFTVPDKCPVCHAPTTIRYGRTSTTPDGSPSGTKTLHCTNPDCPAKQLKKLARFVSKEGMNIDGISEQTLAKFINLGWISEYADIYELRSHILELSHMEGFGEKSASNIMRSIDKSRQVEAHRLLFALNIPLCGLDVCKRLLSAYPLDELVAMATTPDGSPSGMTSSTPVEGDLFANTVESGSAAFSPSDVFAHIPGIGPEKSAQFVSWFRNPQNLARYRRLLTKLTVTTPDVSVSGTLCAGLTFVITGDVHHYKNRNELKAYIESQGGKVASAVSGSTSFLINNDVTSTSGKNKKAKELNIPIISEDEFISKYQTMTQKMKRATLCVQAGWQPKNGESRVLPIIQSTTFKYDNTEEMADLFDLKKEGYFYTRLANPTNDAVASKIAALEGGVGAMLTSSGQAANFYAIFNICQAGDHFVTSNEIYGGTYNLFGVTLKKLGIECTFVSQEASEEEISAAFRPNTKALFGETISNPGCQILDIEKFARIAHKHGVPLIVDNTFPTPINCRPFEWGADIVTHSTTKYMDGHATQVGGAVVDSGNFDWDTCTHVGATTPDGSPSGTTTTPDGSPSGKDKFPGLCTPDESYHGLTYTKAFGKMAYMTKLVAQLMRDLGSIPAPQNAFLLNLGLETLHLRVPRHCENAQRVAEFLENDERVAWVHYSGLPSDKNHALAQKYLPNGSCGVIAFGLKGDRQTAIQFMDSLKMIAIVTHVADARTCVLHPASHTHRQLSDEQLREAGVAPDLIRLSVGIEDCDDILTDIRQALDKI